MTNNTDYIKQFLSNAEGDDIKNVVQKIPLFSFIILTDDTGTYNGILIEIKKTFF